MKNLKKLILSLSSIALTSALTTTIVSCGGTAKTEGYRYNTKEKKEIVLQSAQGNSWPMTRAIKEIIEIYNQEQQSTKHFKKVVYKTYEDTKLFTEKTYNDHLIDKISDKDEEGVPNIVMSNKSLTTSLSRFNMLLDLKGTRITKELFIPSIYQNANLLPGINKDDEHIYTIPYSIVSSTSQSFNLDVMAYIFYHIQKNGAIISKESAIYKKIQAEPTNGEFLTTLIGKEDLDPIDQVGKNYEWGKSNGFDIFKGEIINDKTFSSLESMIDFAIKVNKSLEVKKGEILPSILGIDYYHQIIQKLFLKYVDFDYTKYIYDIDDKGKTLFKFVPKNPKKLTDEEKKHKENIKKIFIFFDRGFVGAKQSDNISGAKENAIRLTENHKGKSSDWSGYALRDNLLGFGINVNVSTYKFFHNPISLSLKKTKEKYNKEQINKFIRENENWQKGQLVKLEKNDIRKIYVADGSNLIPVHTNKIDDVSTIKFLEWLYNGEMLNDIRITKNVTSQDGKEVIQVIEAKKGTTPATFIAAKSGYIIGIKESITDNEITKLKERRKLLEGSEKKNTPRVFEEISKITSVLQNIEDLKESLKDDTETVIINYNSKIASFTNFIDRFLYDNQKKIGKARADAEKFYDELVKKANELR